MESESSASLHKVAVKGLQNPIEVTLKVVGATQPTNAVELVCMTWDEVTQQWSTEGVTGSLSQRDAGIEVSGSLVCKTTHLSLFAAVYQEFEQALICSNIHLFSARGFELLGLSVWMTHPAGLLFWFLVVLTIMLQVSAITADVETGRQHKWTDRDFLLNFSSPSASATHKPQNKKEMIQQKVVSYVVYANMAATARIHPTDMSAAIGQYFASFELTSRTRTSEKLEDSEEIR